MNENTSDNDPAIDGEDFLNTFLEGSEYPILGEVDKLKLDSPFIMSELDEALKSLNFDSSPGSDGLSPIFYSTFWNILKDPLFNSYVESIENFNFYVSWIVYRKHNDSTFLQTYHSHGKCLSTIYD